MNEEELLALADKLYAQGLDDDAVDEHLRRAMLVQGEDKAVGGGLGFLTGLAAGVAKPTGIPGGYAGDVGQGPRFDAAQQEAQNQLETYQQAKADQPMATGLGEVTPDAIALLAGGIKTAGPPTRFLGRVAKEYGKQTKIGRAIARAGKGGETITPKVVANPSRTTKAQLAYRAKPAPKAAPETPNRLMSPQAQSLAQQLNELLKQHMAK